MYPSQLIAVISAFLISASVSVLGGAAANSSQTTTSPSRASASSSRTKESGGGTPTSWRKGQRRRAAPRRYVQSAPTPQRYMEIQRALAERGYYKGEVNGAWSADATDALKRFQKDQNLTADGRIGSLSLIALGLGPKRDPTGDLAAKPASETPPPIP